MLREIRDPNLYHGERKKKKREIKSPINITLPLVIKMELAVNICKLG